MNGARAAAKVRTHQENHVNKPKKMPAKKMPMPPKKSPGKPKPMPAPY